MFLAAGKYMLFINNPSVSVTQALPYLFEVFKHMSLPFYDVNNPILAGMSIQWVKYFFPQQGQIYLLRARVDCCGASWDNHSCRRNGGYRLALSVSGMHTHSNISR